VPLYHAQRVLDGRAPAQHGEVRLGWVEAGDSAADGSDERGVASPARGAHALLGPGLGRLRRLRERRRCRARRRGGSRVCPLSARRQAARGRAAGAPTFAGGAGTAAPAGFFCGFILERTLMEDVSAPATSKLAGFIVTSGVIFSTKFCAEGGAGSAAGCPAACVASVRLHAPASDGSWKPLRSAP
jgi:hypothetical protein